jgi:hypothetical protein
VLRRLPNKGLPQSHSPAVNGKSTARSVFRPQMGQQESKSLKSLRLLIALSFTCQFLPSSYAAIYYVSPAGSDSNLGTSSAPLLTIQRAADIVNPGDTVIVRDGTYSNVAATGVGSKLITMSRGGTASSWVTFMAEHTWRAVIDGLNNTTAEGWSFAASYIRVQGFEVKGFSDDAFSNYSGGHFWTSSATTSTTWEGTVPPRGSAETASSSAATTSPSNRT